MINLSIDLTDLKQGRNSFGFPSLEAGALELKNILGAQLGGSVAAGAVVIKDGKKLVLELKVKFTLVMQCSRCLEEIIQPKTESAVFRIRPSGSRLPREMGLKDKDIWQVSPTNGTLDIAPLIREMILLSVPMKPLCKPDCKGLCPVCGANWNTETCQHQGETGTEKVIDPRWAKLLELKEHERD